jgi:hypothetical protein
VPSPAKLIVYLEDPHIYVKVVSDEPCERLLEFLALVDVIRTDRNRNVTLLEDALGA